MSTWTVPSYGEDWAVPGYTEERELGRGASGKVVEAVNDATGQRVAIKYLSPALLRDPAFMWGFRTEAQLLRSLGVPQVVQVYDYVEQPDQGAAIVMELVNGVSLHEMIARRGPTGPEAALTVLKGSLLGLAAAHTLGIVHRDYKPENVLVDAAGNSKLADFGVAVRMGKQAPAAGTPLYMAPEQWQGAPASPATDVYAVTAVFYECLTGKTPFSGKLLQLQEQHVTASVPLERIDEPLQGIIARGMAKNPAGRPQSAIAFVAELEAVAGAAFGPDWEERGRSHLAERAAALLPLLLRDGKAGSSGSSSASTWLGGGRHRATRKRRAVTVAAITTVAVVAVAAVATAVTLKEKGHKQNVDSSSQVATITPSFKAVASVTPPVAASKCAAPTSFTYSGTLSATAPGTVKYQWVYSAGQPGPVQSVSFTGAGHKTVSGETVKTKKAGNGWAEIKMISPLAQTSNKASYKLLCNKPGASQVGASASVQVPPSTGTCPATPPNLTATGSISDTKAGAVTYYWAQSDGQVTAPATLTFTGPGTMTVAPLTITPPGDPGSGEAVLVVTSPVATASSPATYSLSCKAPATHPLTLAATASVSPASQTLTSCTAAAPTFTFSGTISDNKAGTVSYHWKLPSGNGATQTVSFAQAGSKTVSTTYKPTSDSASGSGSVIVTSPSGVTSNAAAFTVACGKALTMAKNAPATATVGTAYSGTVTVSGGKGTYTWAAVTGLPAGLKASASGATLTISGTPTAAGAFTIPLSVHDGATPPGAGTTSIALTVGEPKLAVTDNAPGTATIGTAYSGSVTASGGNGSYKWSATGLPAGLTSSASGAKLTISGTPATSAKTFTATVTVSDTEATAQTATTSVTITVTAPALRITTASLPSGAERSAYSATVVATGGTGTIMYTASGLPTGLSMSSTGTISGTPGAEGSFAVVVTATAGTTTSASYALVITGVTPPPSSAPPSTPTVSSTPKSPSTPAPTPTPSVILE
jgi:serine/threonine-protein kinase